MFSQAAAMEKGFFADGTLLRPTAVVSHVENQVRLFRVTGTALAAGERPALLQLVTRRTRIPIAEALLMAPQVPGKGETLATVFAIVLSFRVVPSNRVREKLCNIINHSSIGSSRQHSCNAFLRIARGSNVRRTRDLSRLSNSFIENYRSSVIDNRSCGTVFGLALDGKQTPITKRGSETFVGIGSSMLHTASKCTFRPRRNATFRRVVEEHGKHTPLVQDARSPYIVSLVVGRTV